MGHSPTLAESQAAQMVGGLWAAVRTAGGPRPDNQSYHYFSGIYDPAWLATLLLPIDEARPAEQPVALLESDRQGIFEQHLGAGALKGAYDERRRTRVYLAIGHNAPDAWYAITARHLGRLAKSKLGVVSTIYQSFTGDESIGPHRDRWYGANIQMKGAKLWRLGEEGDEREVLAEPGSILLLPNGLLHDVSTPAEPGHSVHITFAICRTPPV